MYKNSGNSQESRPSGPMPQLSLARSGCVVSERVFCDISVDSMCVKLGPLACWLGRFAFRPC